MRVAGGRRLRRPRRRPQPDAASSAHCDVTKPLAPFSTLPPHMQEDVRQHLPEEYRTTPEAIPEATLEEVIAANYDTDTRLALYRVSDTDSLDRTEMRSIMEVSFAAARESMADKLGRPAESLGIVEVLAQGLPAPAGTHWEAFRVVTRPKTLGT